MGRREALREIHEERARKIFKLSVDPLAPSAPPPVPGAASLNAAVGRGARRFLQHPNLEQKLLQVEPSPCGNIRKKGIDEKF